MNAYLWIRSPRLLVMQMDGINHADYGGIDGGIGAADGGHCRETLRGKQHSVSDACVHGIEREHRITAICSVKLKQLDEQNLAPFVRRDFLRRDDVPDHAADEHTTKCRGLRQNLKG